MQLSVLEQDPNAAECAHCGRWPGTAERRLRHCKTSCCLQACTARHHRCDGRPKARSLAAGFSARCQCPVALRKEMRKKRLFSATQSLHVIDELHALHVAWRRRACGESECVRATVH